MSNNAIVWVVQEGNNDYAPAEKIGEIRFITKTDYRSMPDSEQSKQVIADIRKFLTQYIAGKDFIAPAGNPITCALVAMALSQGEQAKHNYLKWDGRMKVYVPFKIGHYVLASES